MKCINKKISSLFITLLLVLATFGCASNKSETEIVSHYLTEHYNRAIEVDQPNLAKDLCVSTADVNEINYSLTEDVSGAALFDLEKQQVLFGHHLFDQVYPASTTKIMTALLLLENVDLNDTITVPAKAVDLPSYASLCGIKAGDEISYKDLLYGLLLPSGNDAAAAIAISVGGSIEGFADMMNEKAQDLMATHTHFVNPHGLHDNEHYTTPYDLYLIFNACIKNSDFVDCISTPSYECEVTQANGEKRSLSFENSNYYLKGTKTPPETIVVEGGKTGTTTEAKNCLIMLAKSKDAKTPYISMVLGASSRDEVYENMSGMYQDL